ncbi:hypothetical protein THRCLA_01067 [Thraustotheca clavata]|uniref:Uncharacterized protein n=1 Tax=Thraustotheca clavata TaxID=74557 RepID=A0A1W0A9E7_9STRA|nr:hypothetical protein THRCLA_01067 [Thraustotheca clavata]
MVIIEYKYSITFVFNGPQQVNDLRTTTSPLYKIDHNIALFVASLTLSLSVLSFLAYTSERLPWPSRLPHIPQLDKFTVFNTSTLIYTQQLYNKSTLHQGSTLPQGSTYADIERDTFVFRRLLRPQEYTTCESLLQGLPGVVFYNPTMKLIVCASINANASMAHERGACLVMHFLSIPITQ